MSVDLCLHAETGIGHLDYNAGSPSVCYWRNFRQYVGHFSLSVSESVSLSVTYAKIDLLVMHLLLQFSANQLYLYSVWRRVPHIYSLLKKMKNLELI